MKRRGVLFALVLALLTGVGLGCQQSREPEETDYVLYFVNDGSRLQSGALQAENYPFTGEGEPEPEELVQALLKGPASEQLRSPFPKGVTLQWCKWDESREGHIRVGLSEQYGGLTDIALTLADYSIVLTLGQLEAVQSVEITALGQKANSRSHQVLTVEEAVLLDYQIGQ